MLRAYEIPLHQLIIYGIYKQPSPTLVGGKFVPALLDLFNSSVISMIMTTKLSDF